MPERARVALLERLLAAVPGGVVYVSGSGTIELVNDEALRLSGFSRAEVLGRSFLSLELQLLDERGRPLSVEERPLVRALAGEVVPPMTLAYRARDREGWAVFRVTRLPLDDSLGEASAAGVVVSFVDITDRIRAEQKERAAEDLWRTLATNFPDQVVITDVDGRIQYTNRYYPGQSAETVLGTTVWEWVEPDRRDYWREQFLASIRTQTIVRFDTMGGAYDGGKAWYECLLVPSVEHGAVSRVIVLGRDVTERRMIIARIAEHDRLVSLGMVAASVAHEIMNPLTYVLVNLEYAITDKRGDDERRARALVDAREGALRMQQIVRDLRSLGRSGAEELFYVDMRSVVETAMRLAGPELAHAGEVSVELDDLPAVLANESRLCQVFINLLVNAAQAVRDQPVRAIRVRSVRDEATEFVGVAVRDSGPGIPPSHHAFIFEPFYTTKTQGTGLGLSITRDIVTRMGGRVDIESALGEGATFTVWLPTRRTPTGRPLAAPTQT